MKLAEVNDVNIDSYLTQISKNFNLSKKEFVCIGVDYESLDSITRKKFCDDGDLIPEWTIFIIDLVSRIIKEKEGNVILTKENSLKNILMNNRFNSLPLTLTDFIDTCFQYFKYDLGFFIVWKASYSNNSEVTSFDGLITPVIDGLSIICIADKNDSILQHIKNSC